MTIAKHALYINDVPRYGLGIVFLIFGIDKFLIHEFYVSWFTATERVRIILPLQDISSSIYLIGIVELVFAALLFAGVGIRWTSIAVSAWMIAILSTAQYPSSFPQDIGLLGVSVMLILSGVAWKNAYTEKFLGYLWVMRYPISAVLFIWAIDHIVNYIRHIGWMQLASPIARGLLANDVASLIISIAIVEIVLAGMMAAGKLPLTKYSLVAATIFFVFARVALAPPVNNHQSIGLAFATAWLAYIAFSKRRV